MAASIRTGSPAGGHSLLKNYHRPVLWVVLACLFDLDSNPLMVPFASDPLLHGLVKIGAYLLLFGVIEQAVAFLSGGRPDGQPLLPQMHSAGLYGLIITAMVSLAGLYAAVLVHNIRMIAAAAGAG